MDLRNLKVIENSNMLEEFKKEKELLLLYSSVIGGFALFNMSIKGVWGYYKDPVYKGITEEGRIHNIGLHQYAEAKQTKSPFTYFMYFNEKYLNEDDKAFLQEKRVNIMEIINKKKNHREMMEIKT